ncbi:MAG: endonuclease/exonuclease/phosphatase family protein [Candidatus Promineifilaceae bacterium]|nr:endonuclease/exonuclease/phosphatase family protein [Candidatus Promineifilaceae bacterium]
MPFPLRFVVCSLNLWADARWSEREEPVRQFFNYHRPDILALQELRPVSRDLLDNLLRSYERVDDPFSGWHFEGNIYWNSRLFRLLEYGAEAIGILESKRRLFWVRLRPRAEAAASTLLIATAHYTWPGHQEETETGVNPRTQQARETVAALHRLNETGEALIFMGDMNDFHHPLRVLRESGLEDAFRALGRTSPPTRPSQLLRHEAPPQVNDWILHRGPLRPMCCDVVDFYAGGVPPSDHKPVLVTYALEED